MSYEVMGYEEYLWKKYRRLALSIDELISELPEDIRMTERQIKERARKCSGDIPEFARVGRKIVFPIKAVAKYFENTIKVAR